MDDLPNSFKQAANSVAILYKEALSSTKKAKQEGYSQCLNDLYHFISSQSHITKTDLETFFRAKLFDLHNESSQEIQSLQELSPNFNSPTTPMSNNHFNPSTSLPVGDIEEHLKRRWIGSESSKYFEFGTSESPSKKSRHSRHESHN